MRRFRLLALLGIVVGVTGCGLPDSYYLEPPAADEKALPLSPSFKITGTSRAPDTGGTFQGYELYYKFYGNDTDATFNSDATSFGKGSTYTDLTTGGFHRLCLAIGTPVSGMGADTSVGSLSAPLINILQIDSGNIGNSYTVTIRLNDLNPILPAPTPPTNRPPLSYYVYTPPGVNVDTSSTCYEEVRRYVAIPNATGCKTFAPNSNNITSNATNYDNVGYSDADLNATTGQAIWTQVTGNNAGFIFVMIYALSYGKAPDGSTIYSYPVKLGYTKILVSP